MKYCNIADTGIMLGGRIIPPGEFGFNDPIAEDIMEDIAHFIKNGKVKDVGAEAEAKKKAEAEAKKKAEAEAKKKAEAEAKKKAEAEAKKKAEAEAKKKAEAEAAAEKEAESKKTEAPKTKNKKQNSKD